MERTLAIVKPDAVERGLAGEILRRIEASGLVVSAIKKIHLSRAQAERFYDVHKERPFYKSLCDYMTSGPVVIAVLTGGSNHALARADGRHRSCEGSGGYDPQRPRNRR